MIAQARLKPLPESPLCSTSQVSQNHQSPHCLAQRHEVFQFTRHSLDGFLFPKMLSLGPLFSRPVCHSKELVQGWGWGSVFPETPVQTPGPPHASQRQDGLRSDAGAGAGAERPAVCAACDKVVRADSLREGGKLRLRSESGR